jgi:ATP-binding cassette subfamily B multidrug efflux pump
MSTAVKQFHEEEAIGKTYDLQVARRLLSYLRPYARLLIPALILTLLLNLLVLLQPQFTQWAIDGYILPKTTVAVVPLTFHEHFLGSFRVTVLLLALIYLAVQLARFVFSYFQVVLLNTIGQYVMFDLRRELYDKLQHQEVAYYDRNPVGRIMSRLTADVDALNELFTSGVTDLLGDLVMIAGIIAVMAWKDPRLTLVTLLTVPMLIAATTWFRKGARRGYDMVRTRVARIYAFLQEHVSGAQTVQIFNGEAKSLARFAGINDQHRKANIDTIFYYAVFFPLVDFIGAVGIALIIWYGGYRVMSHALSLGALVAFIQYSGFLFQPIRDISDKYNVLQGAVVASHRICPAAEDRTRRGPHRIRERLVCLQRQRLGFEGCFVHRRAGTICGPGRSYRFRQDHDHKPPDAFLRRAEGPHPAGRCGCSRVGTAITAREFRGCVTGHFSFHRHGGKQHPPGPRRYL